MTLRDGSPALPCLVSVLLAVAVIAAGLSFLPEPQPDAAPNVVQRLAATVMGQVIAAVGVAALIYGMAETWALNGELRRGQSPAGWAAHAFGRAGASLDGPAIQAAMSRRSVPLSYAAWSLPLFGFIGTVLGLSEAIGGLGGVFDGTSDREEALTAVLSDLRFAFDTTLAGLVLVLPVMALYSVVQSRASRIVVA